MAINVYNNATSGNPTNTWVSPELLKAADTVQVFDKLVKKTKVPKNKNENATFLRAVTPAVDTTESAEGISKASHGLVYESVAVRVQEHAMSFAMSSRQRDMSERDILADSKDRLVDGIARTRELNGWYTYRNGNNVLYNSAAITARNQVNGFFGVGTTRLASRFLSSNRGGVVTSGSKGSTNDNTFPIEAGYVILTHTDCRSNYRDLPGFTIAAAAGGAKDNLPQIFGYFDDFCVITSPEFEPRLAAGAAVGATNMKSIGGVNVDVYTSVIMAKEAFGRVSLAGSQSEGGLGGLSFTVLNQADKSDRDNRICVVGAQWHDGPIILNQNWAIAIEHGVDNVPA